MVRLIFVSIILVCVGLSSAYAVTIEGRGIAPYDLNYPYMSKIAAIEDAIHEAQMKRGGELNAFTQVRDEVISASEVSLINSDNISNIEIRECHQIDNLMKCTVRVDFKNIHNQTADIPRTLQGKCTNEVSDKNIIEECYIIKQDIVNNIGEVKIFIRRLGGDDPWIRFEVKKRIIGLGRTTIEIRESLEIQAKYFFERWIKSDERKDIIKRESLLRFEQICSSTEKGNAETFIKMAKRFNSFPLVARKNKGCLQLLWRTPLVISGAFKSGTEIVQEIN